MRKYIALILTGGAIWAMQPNLGRMPARLHASSLSHSLPASMSPPSGQAAKIVPIRTYEATITAYTNGYESTGKTPAHTAYGITASGEIASWGALAGPPELPYGTVIRIPGYGIGIVSDRGQAIKGNRLDVWMDSIKEARQWGIKRLRVEVLYLPDTR